MTRILKYPFETQINNELAFIIDSYEKYDQQIKIFFLTPSKSRIGRPELGTKIYQYLGEPITDELYFIINQTIKDEFERFFPNLSLLNSTFDQENKSIIINYNLRIEKNPLSPRTIKVRLFE